MLKCCLWYLYCTCTCRRAGTAGTTPRSVSVDTVFHMYPDLNKTSSLKKNVLGRFGFCLSVVQLYYCTVLPPSGTPPFLLAASFLLLLLCFFCDFLFASLFSFRFLFFTFYGVLYAHCGALCIVLWYSTVYLAFPDTCANTQTHTYHMHNSHIATKKTSHGQKYRHKHRHRHIQRQTHCTYSKRHIHILYPWVFYTYAHAYVYLYAHADSMHIYTFILYRLANFKFDYLNVKACPD